MYLPRGGRGRGIQKGGGRAARKHPQTEQTLSGASAGDPTTVPRHLGEGRWKHDKVSYRVNGNIVDAVEKAIPNICFCKVNTSLVARPYHPFYCNIRTV